MSVLPEPEDEAAQHEISSSAARSLLVLARPYRRKFVVIALLSAIATGLGLLQPLVYRMAINDVAGVFVYNTHQRVQRPSAAKPDTRQEHTRTQVAARTGSGALGAFRAIYYLAPLVVAGGAFAAYEGLVRRDWLRAPGELYSRWVSGMVPRFLAATTFAGGIVLLFSGATPAVQGRLFTLRDILPLPVLEISHFLGSLAGLGLLLLAAALQRRLDVAYHLAAMLLGCGVVLSLLKGLDYEEAILLGLMLVALLPCRRYFYRHSALLREPLTPGRSARRAADSSCTG